MKPENRRIFGPPRRISRAWSSRLIVVAFDRHDAAQRLAPDRGSLDRDERHLKGSCA
jgi:hypothetical protein